MTSGKQARINIIGPALRALTGEGERFKLVSFSDTTEAPQGFLRFEGGNADEEEAGQLVKRLADVVVSTEGVPPGLVVDGVGCFEIREHPVVRGRVAGKVAVVTGAAQGIGKEMARDLVSEGAIVFLADINMDGVQESASEINQAYTETRAYSLEMNVTDEQGVAEAVGNVVRQVGGIDILIANAGVLKADSVKRLPLKDFALVRDVNYTGYFLCVQHVSPIMSVQHMAEPQVWADIIQMNSKSGLTGSNRNPAYAGSKFGGIGLTQSFALELVDDGIKVNAVCPGNFLDSPLWSDPETGLFVQYLRAGKVPGAETIADVRRAYEAKVPMKRGCRPADAMKAVYYLIEQDYETGQALPVTGGQVMMS